jgi:hypothetical protein
MNRDKLSLFHKLALAIVLFALAAGTAQRAEAAIIGGTIEIIMSDVDIEYDGTNIFDSDPIGGDPDALSTASFFQSEVLQGVLTTDLTLDLFIPNVTGILTTGSTIFSNSGGNLTLRQGNTVLLDLTLGSAEVIYTPFNAFFQFVFTGASGTIDSQALPFGLGMVNPISVSFSTQIDPNSLTTNGSTVIGFRASGSGENEGTPIPEPASLVLLGLGGLVALRRHR